MTLRQFIAEKGHEGYGWEDIRVMAIAQFPQAHNVADWRRMCFKVWRGDK